jgi:hypothetical protein
MSRYCIEGDYKALQALAGRLIGIEDDERFAEDDEIRLLAAKGSFWLVVAHGDTRDFAAMEDWLQRLQLRLEGACAAGAELVAAEYVRCFGIGICRYSTAARFLDVERWGEWLATTVSNGPLAGAREVRLAQAFSIIDVMGHYASALRLEAMEDWGRRLLGIVENPRFRDDPAFHRQAAQAVQNAVPGHARAGDLAMVEQWGNRLSDLTRRESFAADPDIRLSVVQAIDNILKAYDDVGRHDWPAAGRWRERLAHIARTFPLHSEVQYVARERGLDWTSQRVRMRGSTPRRGH